MGPQQGMTLTLGNTHDGKASSDQLQRTGPSRGLNSWVCLPARCRDLRFQEFAWLYGPPEKGPWGGAWGGGGGGG